MAGFVILLSAVAYRSAKKVKVGLVAASIVRTAAEIAAIVLAVAAVALQKDFASLAYRDPVPNLIIPFWAIVAYVIAKTARRSQPAQPAAV